MKIRGYIFIICILLFAEGLLFSASFSQDTDSPNLQTDSECSEILTWKIGDLDPRFNVDRETLKGLMSEVSGFWKDASGGSLIRYSDSGDLTLNLIYSDQQKYTDDEKLLSERIRKMRQHFYSMQLKYQRQSEIYGEVQNRYNSSQEEYNSAVDKYNGIIARSRAAGFVSGNDDQRLEDLKPKIERMDRALDTLFEEMIAEEMKTAQLSVELIAFADRVNKFIFRYKSQFDSWKTFHQGVYLDVGGEKKINVYQFGDIKNLKLILAHEAGHALGLAHSENPQSVMYYHSEDDNMDSFHLTYEDLNALTNRCKTDYGPVAENQDAELLPQP